MQKQITIKGIKLTAQKTGGHIPEITTVEYDGKGDKATGTKKHTALVHPDLTARLQQMGGHYAVMVDKLTEMEFTAPTADTANKLMDVYVSGYHIGGSDDIPGIMITGHFKNSRGKAVIANTPFEPLNVTTGNSYPHMEHLNKCVDFVDKEVRLFLTGEKRGEAVVPEEDAGKLKQATLNMEGNSYPNGATHASPEAMARVADPEPAKTEAKRGRKKLPQTAQNPGGGDAE